MHDTLFKRQIRWALGAKSLLSSHHTPLNVSEFKLDQIAPSEHYLELMNQWLERQPHTNRIGIQYEHIFAAYLHACPITSSGEQARYHPIYQRLQVHQGLHKRTLGEFDFVFKDSVQDRWIHTEIAVKFYLGLGPSLNQLNAWLGPNKKDRLDLKYHKLFDRQLQLAHSPEGQAVLESLQIEPQNLSRQYCFSGVLFLPWQQDMPHCAFDAVTNSVVQLPNEVASDCHLGYWLSIEDLPLLIAKDHGSKWLILQRKDWICGEDEIAHAVLQCTPSSFYPQTKLYTQANLSHGLSECFAQFNNPVQILRIHSDGARPSQRYFVTPAQWSETTNPFLSQ